MTDALFVARAQYRLETGFRGAASAARKQQTASAKSSLLRDSVEISPAARILARQSASYGQSADRLSSAATIIETASGNAGKIANALGAVLDLIDLLEPAQATLQGGTPAVTEQVASGSRVELTGSVLAASSPVSVGGSVALSDDVAASGFGDLTLAPVSATGTVSLTDDAQASVTGTRNVATNNSFVLSGIAGQGQTLTIDAGNGVTTITFGVFGGQVNSGAGLEAAIDAIDGVEASYTAEGYLTITGGDADTSFTIGGSVNAQSAFGIAEQTYQPGNLLSQGLSQGETLTFQVASGGEQTITFGTGAGEVSTLAELDAALGGLAGVTASIDGSNRITFAAENAEDAVSVGGTADIATVFGLEATVHDPLDLLNQGIAAGETLTFQIGGEALQTITFGTGAGEVNTVGELDAALAGLSGIAASIDGSNRLSFAAGDPARSVTVGGSADISGVLGVTPGTYEPLNLLDQGISQGDTLTFQVGEASVQTITFGSGDGEVSTLAELEAELENLSGVTAGLDAGNRLDLTADDANDAVTLGGSASVAAALGISLQNYLPDDLLSQGLLQGETLTFQVNDDAVQTIVFGTGAGEVSTRDELDAALQALTGLSAAVNASGQITVSAAGDADTITVAGTADTETALGLAQQTHEGVTITTVEVTPEVAGVSVYPDIESANKSIFDALSGRFADITSYVEAAGSGTDPNLINGQTLTVRLSEGSSAETLFGGYALGLEALDLKGALEEAPASAAGLAALREKVEAAVLVASDAHYRLEQEGRVVAAHKGFSAGAETVFGEAAEKQVQANGFRSSLPDAIERVKLAGQQALALRANHANAAAEGPAVAQIIQQGLASEVGTLFSTTGYGSAGFSSGNTLAVL